MCIMMNVDVFPALPLEMLQKHKNEVLIEFEARWNKVLQKKTSFAPFEKKSDEKVMKEFQELQAFRYDLWYRNLWQSPRICNEDYMAAQDLLEKGYYRKIANVAFAYNRTDSTYNASTVMIEGLHFIAMQEPCEKTIDLFFKFLMNHHVNILVRLNPSHEYSKRDSVKYWEKRHESDFLNIVLPEHLENCAYPRKLEPIPIFYCSTDEWEDDKGIPVKELYRLVQEVRRLYRVNGGAIAVHCACGVGRTGTFIAAYVLAQLIDISKGKMISSIEEIVLKLSIQRPNLMGTAEQYLTLYRFVDHYLQVMREK